MDSATSGALIAGRYRLVRPLGAGSSATVWEATDTALDRTVAVKLLHGPALADPTERERLRREARALARLAHPRITIVFDYLEQAQPGGTQPVLITELLHGGSLAQRLLTGPMPPAQAVAVCAQLADALRAAHEAGIVHRDVKPGNVMLTASGAKLLDFGIAQAATDSNLTGSMAIGTPSCMAPEQLTGRGAVPATDVYALGCVLYWCLTGRPPFDNADVMQVAQAHIYTPAPPLNVSDMSPIVVDVYTRCMAKDATRRPTAAEVYGLLSQAAALPPAAQRTLVMPSFDMPTQRTSPPPAAAQPAGAAVQAAGPQPRTRLLIGALVVAAVAAGVTALALELSHSGGQAGRPRVASSPGAAVTAATAAPSPAPSVTADSPSATPSANATPGNPADDPIGYLESMRAQIDGFIAQGQDTIDANTGRDLQNSLADLENAITSAHDNGGGGDGNSQWHDVKHKIDDVAQKISDDVDNGTISQDAADQLTGELQDLADGLPSTGG